MQALTFKGLRLSDDYCPIHQVPYINYGRRQACVTCQRELIKQQEAEMDESASNRYNKRLTYDRLEMDSICMDLTLKKATFDTFLADNDELKRNKEAARKIAGRYIKGESFNTLLTGNAGAGKSHLAMSILRAVNENSDPWRSCLFLSLDEFLLQIRSTFGNNDKLNHDNEQTLIDRVAKVDLLVIDDLGAETGFIGTEKTASDFTQRVLYNLMNKRQEKPTIITTNLSSDQITRMYDAKVISRLYRNLKGNVIKFKTSEDKRIEKIEF